MVQAVAVLVVVVAVAVAVAVAVVVTRLCVVGCGDFFASEMFRQPGKDRKQREDPRKDPQSASKTVVRRIRD